MTLGDRVSKKRITLADLASAAPTPTPAVKANGKARGPKGQSGTGAYHTLDVVAWFQSHGLYGRAMPDGKHAVDCPWKSEHSDDRPAEASDTVVYEADGVKVWPQFCCLHAHCRNRSISDVKDLWGDADRYCSAEFRPATKWRSGAAAPPPSDADAPPHHETDVCHGRHSDASADDLPDSERPALKQSPVAVWEPPMPLGEVDLPEFPAHIYPAWLREFVDELTTATQTPLDLAGMLVLAATAAAAAGKFIVKVRMGWIEPVNLYLVIALPPAERKSAVVSAISAPIEAFEDAEIARMAPEIAAISAKLKIAEGRLAKAQQLAVKADKNVFERQAAEKTAKEAAQEAASIRVPAEPCLLADDASPEALVRLLSEQDGKIAILSAEGGVFDLMAGRYSGNGAPNLEVYLKAHPGDPIRTHRIGRAKEKVRHPALTLGLAVQPDVIQGLGDTPGFRGRGLLGRFLYSLPKSRLGNRDTKAPGISVFTKQNYAENLTRILTWRSDLDEAGDKKAWILRLSEDAHELLIEFATDLEPQLSQFGELGAISDWGGKLVGALARISGLLHLLDLVEEAEPWQQAIDVGPVQRAIELAHYLIPHARSAFKEMGVDAGIETARHILGWIKRHELQNFSRRDLYVGVKNKYETVELLDPGLDVLMSHGYIRRAKPAERKATGRPPGPAFDVSPHCHIEPNRKKLKAEEL